MLQAGVVIWARKRLGNMHFKMTTLPPSILWNESIRKRPGGKDPGNSVPQGMTWVTAECSPKGMVMTSGQVPAHLCDKCELATRVYGQGASNPKREHGRVRGAATAGLHEFTAGRFRARFKGSVGSCVSCDPNHSSLITSTAVESPRPACCLPAAESWPLLFLKTTR